MLVRKALILGRGLKLSKSPLAGFPAIVCGKGTNPRKGIATIAPPPLSLPEPTVEKALILERGLKPSDKIVLADEGGVHVRKELILERGLKLKAEVRVRDINSVDVGKEQILERGLKPFDSFSKLVDN